jgi:hypothetical protein
MRIPISLAGVELVATEIAIACATRYTTATDNGHRFIQVTGIVEAATHDGFIDLGIIKLNGSLIKAIASCRDVP